MSHESPKWTIRSAPATACESFAPSVFETNDDGDLVLKSDAVHFLSITLDPVRDTPEVLERYVRLYDLDPGNWSFLTGPVEQVNQTLAAWGMWARPTANGQQPG